MLTLLWWGIGLTIYIALSLLPLPILSSGNFIACMPEATAVTLYCQSTLAAYAIVFYISLWRHRHIALSLGVLAIWLCSVAIVAILYRFFPDAFTSIFGSVIAGFTLPVLFCAMTRYIFSILARYRAFSPRTSDTTTENTPTQSEPCLICVSTDSPSSPAPKNSGSSPIQKS
ncbi:MAG: hypothetical protein K2M05_06875 [Paramuribaculum sp.]|nr:hypothetical protein [Paramuribaculum sp.]MDE6304515.1 hypothetical protein [Paramuribaculum sp.]